MITPLGQEIGRIIAEDGPIPLDRYMALCLSHPRYGYYMTRDPLGAAGDFITAPEVTQMFGELIGIWCATVYDAMGRPDAVNLIELGPGRGTLLSDALRAARVIPGFMDAATLRLVEISPVLLAAQRAALEGTGAAITWHQSLEEIPEGPSIVVANEFFDALPVRQVERRKDGWAERCVGLKDGALVVGLVPGAAPPSFVPAGVEDGDVLEVSPASQAVATLLGERMARAPGAALVIDYGHARSSPGETLQAVHGHDTASVIENPGENDITAHVDFAALRRAMASAGARVFGPMTQRDFLMAMGLETRLGILSRKATPEQRRDLELAAERVAGPEQMGHLFKVLAATSPDLPSPHPFQGSAIDD